MKNSFSALLSIGLILLAGAMAWLAYSIQGVIQELPAVIAEVEEVNTRIDAIVAVILPVVTEVGMVRKAVPPILDEVAQIRALVPGIVDETANIRRDITPVLERVESVQAQVKEIQATLPQIAETVDTASKAVTHAADQVDKIVAESEALRRSVPITLTRVEAIVFDAGEVGAKATKGAVTGVVKGIIFSPFQLIKAAGNSITESLFSTREITDEDKEQVVDAANQLLNNLELQSVNWKNPKSGNRGHVSLEKAFTKDGVQCVSLRFALTTKSGHEESTTKVACLSEGGGWAIKE